MKEKMTFQDAMARLDEITAQLEQNDIALEEAIDLFEEGLKLIHQCDGQLKGFEEKVSALLEQYQERDEGAL